MAPSGNVEHRTIGRWAGDYSVLSRGRVPSVHFLVGQEWGQWVQFYSIYTTCAHAAGANTYAVGIEFSGQNGEPLTAWQIIAGRVIHQFLIASGIPARFNLSPDRTAYFNGFLNHAQVATSPQYRHYDFILFEEWVAMVSGAPAPPPTPDAPAGAPPTPRKKQKMVYVLLANGSRHKGRRVYADGTGYVFLPDDLIKPLQFIGVPFLDVRDKALANTVGDRAAA